MSVSPVDPAKGAPMAAGQDENGQDNAADGKGDGNERGGEPSDHSCHCLITRRWHTLTRASEVNSRPYVITCRRRIRTVAIEAYPKVIVSCISIGELPNICPQPIIGEVSIIISCDISLHVVPLTVVKRLLGQYRARYRSAVMGCEASADIKVIVVRYG